MKTYQEINQVNIQKGYDVAVIGGGIAGISASLSAARNGMNTLLVEKGVMTGGLATSGLIVHYLPLCDGYGNKVTGGIAEELLHLSIKYGYNTLPDVWKSGATNVQTKLRYKTYFNAPAFVLALDEVLEESGIQIFYDTNFSNVALEDGKCTGIIIDNISGRHFVPVKAVIDTTGSADVFSKAGAPVVLGNSKLSYWAQSVDFKSITKALEKNDLSEALVLNKIGHNALTNLKEKSASDPSYKIQHIEDTTRFITDGRGLLKKYLEQMKSGEKMFGCLPSIPQLRTTRRIKGMTTMTASNEMKHVDDSVGCVSDWRKAGPVFEIPLRSLVVDGFQNMFAAGRCMSAEGDTWEVMRCIPQAAATGQAAGAAASLCVRQDTAVTEIHYDCLAQHLSDSGVVLDYQNCVQ